MAFEYRAMLQAIPVKGDLFVLVRWPQRKSLRVGAVRLKDSRKSSIFMVVLSVSPVQTGYIYTYIDDIFIYIYIYWNAARAAILCK